MAKKSKASLVDLDTLLTKDKILVIKEDELKKIRETKSDTKALPSITGRMMAEALFKAPGEARGIDMSNLNQEQKESTIRTTRKELARWARHKDRIDLRVKFKDQGDRAIFWYEKKKSKEEKEKEKKAKAKARAA